MSKRIILAAVIIALFSFFSCERSGDMERASDTYVEKNLEKFAPYTLSGDLSSLPESERKALRLIVEAAQVMDDLFLRQVYNDNLVMQTRLEQMDAKIVGLTFLVELKALGGREKLGEYPIHTEIVY